MSATFDIVARPMDGLAIVARTVRTDERGFLARLFDAEDMAALGWPGGIAQVNHTLTRVAGTLRGLHYQRPPHTDAKLVSCLSGRILDVAVDIRAGSPTFLSHVAVELSADNARALMIAPGFAHGFQALSDDVELVYCHSQPYRAEAEAGLDPFDPALRIDWPLPVAALSERDRQHPPISASFEGIAP